MGLDTRLVDAIQQLSFCHDVETLMQALKGAVADLVGADGVTVVLREGDLCYYADEQAVSPLWKGQRFPMERCISGWCMLNRRQVAIADIYADDRIPHDAYRPTFVRSLAMTPIRRRDPIGAIGAYWSDHHRARAGELATLQALADSAATAFANVELVNSLHVANRRKDEFLSMLAHELRSPMAPMRNALEIMRIVDDPDRQSKARDLLERQFRHLIRIVDDLLDVARVTSGKMELHRARLDLAQVLAGCCEDRRSILKRAGLALAVEVPQLPVWVDGDESRLLQVFTNVLDNARKFTPSGGEVSVQLRETSDDRATIVFSDTGVGVSPEVLPQIFETFVQGAQGADRSVGGLGLGLSLARRVVELHDGSIEAASDGYGRGTKITIHMPRSSEPRPFSADPVVTAPLLEGLRLRVLVVEDNRDTADSLRTLLGMSGFDVEVAFSGPEGLEKARRCNHDVVLCDIGLPGMNGLAVASALRGDPQTACLRLIALTGYGRDEDRRQALAAGFDLHLVKPVEPDRLLRHLRAPPSAA